MQQNGLSATCQQRVQIDQLNRDVSQVMPERLQLQIGRQVTISNDSNIQQPLDRRRQYQVTSQNNQLNQNGQERQRSQLNQNQRSQKVQFISIAVGALLYVGYYYLPSTIGQLIYISVVQQSACMDTYYKGINSRLIYFITSIMQLGLLTLMIIPPVLFKFCSLSQKTLKGMMYCLVISFFLGSLLLAILEVIVFSGTADHCQGFSLALSIISAVMHPLVSLIFLVVVIVFICKYE